jgi:predicted phage tail protein
MRTIRVYGQLARFLKRRAFRAEVASAAEAVRFLVANFPQVEAHMAQQHYHVSVGDRALEPEELHEPAGQSEITIVPVIGGAGAAGRIIGGVALVAAAFMIGQPWLGPYAFSMITGVGASLALGGVAQLLTPVPRIAGPGAAARISRSPGATRAVFWRKRAVRLQIDTKQFSRKPGGSKRSRPHQRQNLDKCCAKASDSAVRAPRVWRRSLGGRPCAVCDVLGGCAKAFVP